MDAQQFLAEFGHIANAPDGVNRLRDLVLQLAILGRLVDQNSEDSDVEISLLELQRRRKKVLEERGLTATRKHKSLDRPEGWLSVPQSWRWESLGYLSLWPLKDGDWIESKDQDSRGDVRIVQLADVGVGGYRDRSNRFMTSSRAADLGCYFLERDDLLIARLPDPLGRACLFPGDAKPSVTVVDVAVCRCDPELVNPRFLMNCLNSPAVRKLIESWAVGTTRQRVATGRLGTVPLPVAPIEEQTRIVAKVDELMALCNQLAQQQQDRRKLQHALRQSTLPSIASAQSPHELRSSWQRLQANFGQLFSEPSDVAELRSLLVELAIRGALTPKDVQDPSGGLTGQISHQATQRSTRRFAKATRVNPPFDLPSTWNWALFDELLEGSESGWSPKCDAEPRRPGEWGVLKVSAVTWGEFRSEENKRLPPSLDPRPECEVKAGDFLLSRANTADLVARSVIAPPSVPDRLLMSDKIVRLKFVDAELKPWANLVNNSLFAREHYRSNATGTSDSMRNVSRQVIHELPIPLPPKHIQAAVIRRLAELNELCARMEEGLKEKAHLSARLSDAAMAELTGINIELDKDTAVKAPQTELVAPLRLATPPDVKAQAPLATILARHEGEMAARDLWQRFGGDIDAFYAQLKTEVAHGWITEPAVAEVRAKPVEAAGA